MKSKLALKRLTASDLTFFEWHYRNQNAGNQKAINLNKDIFVEQLYPAIPEAAQELEGKVPLDLTIFGPGTKAGLNLQRKIVKLGTYKNWRLNGEFIYNPENDPTRFDTLRPGDFALFEFSGAVMPNSANLILVGQSYPEDITLHTALNGFLSTSRMARLTYEQLKSIISESRIPENHPARNLILDDAIEDAAFGGAIGIERLWKGPSVQHLSLEALQKARANAEDIGRLGEEMIDAFLQEKKRRGEIEDYSWIANINAVAPYDFETVSEETAFIDVKSTSGGFTRSIHISLNELRQMANNGNRYDLFRIYEIEGTNAKLRIATDLKDYAVRILKSLEKLPIGTTPDSFSVNPQTLPFGDEIIIQLSPEHDED